MTWTVQPWVKVLREYRDRPGVAVVEAARAEEKYILELNRGQLFDKGIDFKGQSLGQYAPSTVQYKIRAGQRYDHVTLRDSGDFYANFFVLYSEEEFTIFSDDSKTPLLVQKYGSDILGLTDDNVELLADRLRPAILEAFRVKMKR